VGFLLGVAKEYRLRYPFTTGQSYNIRIDTVLPTGQFSGLYILDSQAAIYYRLVEQDGMEANNFNEALNIAKEADYVLAFVGINIQRETEGQNMTDFSLPADGFSRCPR
jgi:hypothetical protein